MAKKILVVDDDSKDLNAISGILEREGYEVESVGNGASAFDLVSASKYDLLLMDIIMPTLSGYDLLRLLGEKDKSFKIIYISIVPKDKVNLKDVDGFIQKPFTSESLLKSVKEVLGE